MHVAEAAARHWDVEGLHVHVLGDFASLARKASTGPRGDVS